MLKKKILYFILIVLVVLIIFTFYIYFKNGNNNNIVNITGRWSYYSYYIYDNDKLVDKIEGISDEYLDLKDGKMEMCATTEEGTLQCINGTYKIDNDFVSINSNDYVFFGKFSCVMKDNKLILTKTDENIKYVYTFIGAAG